MRKFDFMSQSPNNFIFQKESNRTVLGGVLSIIYLLFALTIFMLYFAKYLLNEPYEIISYISEERPIHGNEKLKIINESEKYNPTLDLMFSLTDDRGYNLSDRFIIYDSYRNIFIERDKIIKRKASDIHLNILFRCVNETDCQIEKENMKMFYLLCIRYSDFIIDSQSDIPITRIPNNYFKYECFAFNPDIKVRSLIRWAFIRYEDTKGLFDIFNSKPEDENLKEKDIFIGGKYQRYMTHIISNKKQYSPLQNNTRIMFMIDTIDTSNGNIFLYEDYKRKKRSILDIAADIFSLWISFYNGFTFLFSKLYSKSFDKYKIIDNILSKQKEILSDNNQKSNQIEDKNLKDNLINKDVDIIDDLIINDDEKIIANDDIDKGEKKERILPKRNCIDFIFNTFYCEKYGYSERQKIICYCNNLMLKHYSVEYILYNQFLMENLFEDYKWNNPKLKNILNNNSLNLIKSYLKK